LRRISPSKGTADECPDRRQFTDTGFFLRHQHPPFITGVRPFRHGTYRLEAVTTGTKFVVHNYGHGGCGISLSWGCAAKVRDIVQASEVVVIGLAGCSSPDAAFGYEQPRRLDAATPIKPRSSRPEFASVV
jgi:hypothetical protein